MNAEPHNTDWQCHGWDDHVLGQLEHGASLTFRQRLEWLEEMSALVARLRADPEWCRRNMLVEGRAASVHEDAGAPWAGQSVPPPAPDPPGPLTPV